jgi:hypothetical protein
VFERVVRRLAIVLSLIVATGFLLFAVDDFDRAANASRGSVAGDSGAVAPTPDDERARERRDGTAREIVDDANDVLLRPFTGVTARADSRWVRRGVPTLLGLLVYGVLLGYVARYGKARVVPLHG